MNSKLFTINPHGTDAELARKMANDIVDVVIGHFSGLADRAVFTSHIERPTTIRPGSWEDTLEALRDVFTHSMQVAHPRFFGHMDSGPLFISVLADWIASALNQNMLSHELSPLATVIEDEVTQWFSACCGYHNGEGSLVSGGTMANYTALLLALHQRTNGRFRYEGIWSLPQRPVILTSDQAHYSIKKIAGGAGLGEQSVLQIASDSNFRMDVNRLEHEIRMRREAGQIPLMVVATAGTTSTGSVDPLADIATVCEQFGVWLHVDAAHGAGALFSPTAKNTLADIERADSITIDPHKWLMQPKGMGMVLTRHDGLLSTLFQADAPYLKRGAARLPTSRGSLTFQGSRRFDALRLWVTRLYLGDEGVSDLVETNLHQVKMWASLLQERGCFELAHNPDLNLLCFRYRPDGLDDTSINEVNERIQQTLMHSGKGFVSITTLRGRRWLRSVFLNPTTTAEDMRAVIEELVRIGQDCWRVDENMLTNSYK